MTNEDRCQIAGESRQLSRAGQIIACLNSEMLEKKTENVFVVEDKDILFKFSWLILNCESA